MIQYKYYHDLEDGYKDIYSRNAEPDDNFVFSSLGSFRRKGGSCFSYIFKNGKSYFLQTTNTGDNFFHGLAGDVSVLGDARSAEYIGQLETRYRKDGDDENYLPKGSLPLRRAECDLSLARGLKPVFARVIDTLVYEKKPVVIVGKNLEELENYVKVALCLLPPQYANTVGFSVGSERIPSFFGDYTHEIGKYVHLVATDCSVTPEAGWVVINLDGYDDKAYGKLRPYAKTLDGLQGDLIKGQTLRVSALVNHVCPCFKPDGTLDGDLLETAICMYNFFQEDSRENASALIRAKKKDKDGIITTNTLVEAVKKLLEYGKHTPLTKEEETLISEAKGYGEVRAFVLEDCARIAFELLAKGEELTDTQRSDAVVWIGSLPTEELVPDGKWFAPLFQIGVVRNVNVLEVLIEAYQSGSREVLRLIFQYAHILETFNYKTSSGKPFSLELMESTEWYPDCKEDVLGAIMLSCFEPSVAVDASEKAKTLNRIRAFSEYAEKSTKTKTEFFEFILRIKEKVSVVSIDCGVMLLTDDFEMLDEDTLKKKVNELSFGERLYLISLDDPKTSDYVALQDKLLMRLSDVTEVKNNVSRTKHFVAYQSFFKRYSAYILNKEEIEEYLGVLEHEAKVSGDLMRYRLGFIVEKYDNMSYVQRDGISQKLYDKTGKVYTVDREDVTKDQARAVLLKPDGGFEERYQITEAISAVVAPKGKPKELENRIEKRSVHSRYLSYVQSISLIFMIIIGVGLALEPIISAVILEQDVLTRVQQFFKPHHWGMILYVGALNMISYLINLKLSNRYILESFRKSLKISFFYGFLPVFLYVVAYVVVYFFL